ncbi:MAG: AAA family ATPase, partial [Treponema sp.]|nr:AAA family ATPase [Treponema sp.]
MFTSVNKTRYNKGMNKRRLPLGVQTFSEIAEDKLVYVDKTARIYDLVTDSGKFVFLARPRRFGKSLLCSTLAALFEGRRELFSGLAIDTLDWEWKKHPVIHIDLNPANYVSGGSRALQNRLNTVLAIAEEKYDVPAAGNDISDRFFNAIK